MNNYHLYEEIGHGKLSTVYKGRRRGTIQYVAIKSVDKSKRSRVMNEVAVSNDLCEMYCQDVSQNSHVCQLLNWYETRNHLWTVSEYCAGGDLSRILKQDGKLPEKNVLKFATQLVHGLLALHVAGIVFADMKPGNVLFLENGDIKLSGFSVSQRVADLEIAFADNKAVPRRGSPFYMAPELFKDSGFHSFASDIWGLGIVIFEMVSGSTPFGACTSFQELQKSITDNSSAMKQTSGMSVELGHLLTRMLEKDPSSRIGWAELIAHSWWEGKIEWAKILKKSNVEKTERYFHDRMSTAIYTRLGKNQFTKLRVYRDFGGASVKNEAVGAVTAQRPLHQAIQGAVTQVDFLQVDNLSGVPLNTKLCNASRQTDPYLAQHISDLQKTYFPPSKK